MQSTDGIVYVIGHTNPDTDSLCSAIAYAYLKNATAPKDLLCGKTCRTD